ncbi:uncharacterized protein LOC121530152 [Drosophila eugracilis]|uniref:uncharacterized protein LOC121530152 n=1 Tax=Drosophila eugracilis TaxID=29029 RepID=UPI001BDB66ED|nr:uncharacterized protein LOC121530152 [Drosophila eugracilis]XP_041674499.1 uncharacterized protein LOC121530152 [Drosophila eugracilis]
MAKHDRIQSYFSHLNSLSEKITLDVHSVKSSYSREAWLALTLKEQEEVLNSYFINKDIYTKYINRTEVNLTGQKSECRSEFLNNDYPQFSYRNIVYLYNGKDLHTYNHQNVGLKIFHDDNTSGCRDEHSSPFSYRTKSQINMSLREYDAIPVLKSSIHLTQYLYLKLKSNISSNQSVQIHASNKIDVNKVISKPENEQRNKLIHNDNEYTDYDEKLELVFRFGSKSSVSNDLSDDENELKNQRQDEKTKLLTPELQIPKGFDFLSNW